jgi:3-methyl-2-oxobutanoate hydroxymethyltransferase
LAPRPCLPNTHPHQPNGNVKKKSFEQQTPYRTDKTSTMSRAMLNTLRIAPQICRPTNTIISSSTRILPRSTPVGSVRWSSHSPLGASLATTRKPITINTIQSLYRKREPITVITAHDFPSAHVADHAGMDIILVGDSLAMVAMGMDDTSEVLLDEMILHCKSVARATKGAFTVRK